MNGKQLIFAFIAFIFTLFVLTIPLWLGSAMPYLSQYFQEAVDAMRGLGYALGELVRLGKDAVTGMIK